MNASDGGQADRVSRLIGMDIEEYLDADQQAHRVVRDDDAVRGWKAMMLAPSIEVCQALLRGERVPWWQLKPDQAERFGVKHGHRHADGRLSLDDFNDRRR